MPGARSLLPYFAVVAGIAVFSMMDAVMKSASIQTGVYNALLWRSGFGCLLMVPVWLATDRRWPQWPALRLHALRAAVVTAMAVLFFWGLVRTPLAEAIALSFIAPLIALYLAAAVLGERVRARAVAGSLLGIAGVIIIAAGRFGDEQDAAAGWGLAAILGSAVLYAWNLILQRQQAQLAGPTEVALFLNVLVGAILLTAAPWLAVQPPTAALRDIASAALLAAISMMLLSWAYARAEAQALVPLEYSGFVWAMLFGWLFFGEVVTAATLTGAILIVSGCWIAMRGRPAP